MRSLQETASLAERMAEHHISGAETRAEAVLRHAETLRRILASSDIKAGGELAYRGRPDTAYLRGSEAGVGSTTAKRG